MKTLAQMFDDLEPFFRARRQRTHAAELLTKDGHVLSTGKACLSVTGDPGNTFWPDAPASLKGSNGEVSVLEMQNTKMPVRDFKICVACSTSIHFHFDV